MKKQKLTYVLHQQMDITNEGVGFWAIVAQLLQFIESPSQETVEEYRFHRVEPYDMKNLLNIKQTKLCGSGLTIE